MSSRKGGGRSVQKWEPEEDAHLTSVLEDLRTANGWSTIADVDWREVSARVDDRSTKQCRERYFNVLDPTIRRTPWLASELDILFRSHAELGNSWQEIAKRIPGRSESQVKNVYYSAVRRAARESERLGMEVKPEFIVTQTAEREVKAGNCSLPGAVSTNAGSVAEGGPAGGAPASQRRRAGSMEASPVLSGIQGAATTQLQTHVSPPIGPLAGPTAGTVLLPAPAMAMTPAEADDDAEDDDDDADLSLDNKPSSAFLQAPTPQPRHTLTSHVATHTSPHQYHMTALAQGMASGKDAGLHDPQDSTHAILPVVVAGGVTHQSVHLYRRKNLVTPSPLGAPSDPPMAAVGQPPSLSLAPAVMNNSGPYVPASSYEGDGDVDLAAANATIDSWLEPGAPAPSPPGAGAPLGPPAGLRINVSGISAAMQKVGLQSSVHSPSLMLAMSHMRALPPTAPSAFMGMPPQTSVRVG